MSAVSPPRRSRDVTVYLVLDPLCVVAFNTSSSMGRLTLMSFAQFERELIGERVRDKIAASKRKGNVAEVRS